MPNCRAGTAEAVQGNEVYFVGFCVRHRHNPRKDQARRSAQRERLTVSVRQGQAPRSLQPVIKMR